MRTTVIIAIAAALALWGCGDDTRPTGGGGGGGGGSDAGGGGLVDSGSGGGGGGGTTDAGTGGGGTTDAGSGGGGTTDAGSGGGGTTDAGSGGGGGDDRTDVVECMGETCTLPDEVCCVGLSGSMCTASDACGGGLAAPQTCDGPEDCSSGEVCCATFPSGTACSTSCSWQELGHDDGDGTGGDSCMAGTFPGSPPTNVCTTSC